MDPAMTDMDGDDGRTTVRGDEADGGRVLADCPVPGVTDLPWTADDIRRLDAALDKALRPRLDAKEGEEGEEGKTGEEEKMAGFEYLRIEALLDRIDEPNRTACRKILNDNRMLFESARGSTHNHQTWDGGYLDHVVDGMNYARHLHAFDASFGRPLPFSESDALLIFFLHDLEKPWRIVVGRDGEASNRPGFDTKEAFKAFRERKLAEYGVVLSDAQMNALTYVEGEMKDYSSLRRVMNELAAFCHKVDVWSARGWFDHPKAEGDGWAGAGRFRASGTEGDSFGLESDGADDHEGTIDGEESESEFEPEPRPDHVRCVADTHADNAGRTWCGRPVFGWVFQNLDHAAMTRRNDGLQTVCPECAAAAIAALASR